MIGRLNQYIEFQEKAKGRKPNGQPSNEWFSAFKTWASVTAVRGREGMMQGHDVSVTKYTLVVRHHQGINNGMRVLTDDRLLEVIDSYPLHGKKQFTEVLCQTFL